MLMRNQILSKSVSTVQIRALYSAIPLRGIVVGLPFEMFSAIANHQAVFYSKIFNFLSSLSTRRGIFSTNNGLQTESYDLAHDILQQLLTMSTSRTRLAILSWQECLIKTILPYPR